MSTYVFLECQAHNPPLRPDFDGESGQHLTDLPQIRADIAKRDLIVAAYNDDIYAADRFRRNTAAFLAQHPHCRLAIRDEYGKEHATEVIQ